MESPNERIEHRLNKLKSIKSVYELMHDTYKHIGMDKSNSPNLSLPHSFTNTNNKVDETKPSDDRVQLFDNVFYDFHNKHQKITKGEEPLAIGIVGKFKTGKSTLINSLIGEKLMGVDVLPATACISILKYGDESKFIAVYKDGTSKSLTRKEYVELSTHQYDKNIEVDCAENNHRPIIEVYHPSEILRQYNIVDTPGFSSLSKSDDEITKHWIGKVDILLWVFDGNKGSVDHDELRLLKSLKEREIVAIVNRLDDKADEPSRKRVVDSISKLYPFKAVLWYAAQPILDYTFQLAERRYVFDGIQKKALNYVDTGKEVEIHYKEHKFSLIDSKSRKEIDAYALPHLYGTEFIDYFNGFKAYLEKLKKEINKLKLEKLENDSDSYFCQQLRGLEQVKDDLLKELEKNENILHEKKKRIENFKYDIHKVIEDRCGNIQYNIIQCIKNLFFSYKEDPGTFWSSYSIKLNYTEKNEIENILRKQIEPFLREMEHNYQDFIKRNELNENNNQELEVLPETYIGHNCGALLGIRTIWRDFETGDKELYEQGKTSVEVSIRHAIVEGLFCEIITKAYAPILDKLIFSIEKKYHESNTKIKSCIDSIANIIN